jgi:C4-dicarboxylate-specific signal transduction histidine kinase
MSWNWQIIGEGGFQFFGKMSASISHEIKNVIAIINENAGLLDDLTVMAEKGMPIDPQRVKTQAGRIQKQIQRADGIVKSMNRLAHSVDEPQKEVDLHDALGLLCGLSTRFASMRGVTLELQPASRPVTIMTSPFFFQNLTWLCLDFAMGATGSGKAVRLSAEKSESGARITLSGLHNLDKMDLGGFPGERGNALLNALKGELEMRKETGELILAFAKDLGGEPAPQLDERKPL